MDEADRDTLLRLAAFERVRRYSSAKSNGRISELRSKLALQGLAIETSKRTDRYGFVYHRLKGLKHPSRLSVPELLALSRENVRDFEAT